MGYHHRARKVTCPNCKRQVAWFLDKATKVATVWTCDCGMQNHIKALPEWPNVPRTLYIGPEKFARFKVYPLPPECPNEDWAKPYSIRSFVHQASNRLGKCHFSCAQRGQVMGELVFNDECHHGNPDDDWVDREQCHLVAGWTTGQTSCPLFQEIEKLCQTDIERKFLHRYLAYVKDRQFPMLIPQTWIGIAERRRPDFAAFIPLQYWNYKWLAIQLDGAHTNANAADDSLRDQYVEEKNYEVMSLRPEEKGYLEEVRRLVEQIESWMELAVTNPWEVAVEAEITKSIPSSGDIVPF